MLFLFLVIIQHDIRRGFADFSLHRPALRQVQIPQPALLPQGSCAVPAARYQRIGQAQEEEGEGGAGGVSHQDIIRTCR